MVVEKKAPITFSIDKSATAADQASPAASLLLRRPDSSSAGILALRDRPGGPAAKPELDAHWACAGELDNTAPPAQPLVAAALPLKV